MATKKQDDNFRTVKEHDSLVDTDHAEANESWLIPPTRRKSMTV